jgi:hypothetical protein
MPPDELSKVTSMQMPRSQCRDGAEGWGGMESSKGASQVALQHSNIAARDHGRNRQGDAIVMAALERCRSSQKW